MYYKYWGKNGHLSQSAFRAVRYLGSQSITSILSSVEKVFFPNELFDLADEYNPSTSTFVASKSGIYSFDASISFQPNDINADYGIVLQFLVNSDAQSSTLEAAKVLEGGLFSARTFTVSDIFHLNAGDCVEVRVGTTTRGTITAANSNINRGATHFAGTRIFPLKHEC